MKPRPLLILVLAARAQSWPQLSFNKSLLPRDAEPGRLLVVKDDIDLVLPVSRPPVKTERGQGMRQLPVEDLDMSAMTLPVSSRERGGSHSERRARQFLGDGVQSTGVPSTHPSKPDARERATRFERQLLVDEDLDMSAMTLPVSTRTRPLEPGAELNARQLPEDDVDSPGVLTLPVLHSTKPGVWKRAIEVELANRSDVAYYAQRKTPPPNEPPQT